MSAPRGDSTAVPQWDFPLLKAAFHAAGKDVPPLPSPPKGVPPWNLPQERFAAPETHRPTVRRLDAVRATASPEPALRGRVPETPNFGHRHHAAISSPADGRGLCQ